MLISKNTHVGSIATFKIITGEEIIAKVVDFSDGTFTLERPHIIVPTGQGFGMLKYLASMDNLSTVPIHTSFIVTAVPTIKEIADQYLEATTNIKIVG